MTVLKDEVAGLNQPCPRCDAQPGEKCSDPKTGRTRTTTHQERKPKESQ